MRCTANQAITLWVQPTLLVGLVAELGSLERNAPKQDGQMANAALERSSQGREGGLLGCAIADSTYCDSIQSPRYLFTALKKSMIALFFPGHSGCVPVPSQ